MNNNENTSSLIEGRIPVSAGGSGYGSLGATTSLDNYDQHDLNHRYTIPADNTNCSYGSSSHLVPAPPVPPPQPPKPNTFKSSLKQLQQQQMLVGQAGPNSSQVIKNYEHYDVDDIRSHKTSDQIASSINFTDQIRAKHSMLGARNVKYEDIFNQISKSLPTNQDSTEIRFKSSSQTNEQNQYRSASADSNMQFMPAKLFASLGREDKKPFAYTAEVNDPNNRGKLDLSQIKSAAMKRRLMANMASSEERDEAPNQDDVSRSSYNHRSDNHMMNNTHHNDHISQYGNQHPKINAQQSNDRARIVTHSPPIIWKQQQQQNSRANDRNEKFEDYVIKYNHPAEFFNNERVNASSMLASQHLSDDLNREPRIEIDTRDPIIIQMGDNRNAKPKFGSLTNGYLDELGFEVERSLESLEQLVSTMGVACKNPIYTKQNSVGSSPTSRSDKRFLDPENIHQVQYHAKQDLKFSRDPRQLDTNNIHNIDYHYPFNPTINMATINTPQSDSRYGNIHLHDPTDDHSPCEFNDQQAAHIQCDKQATHQYKQQPILQRYRGEGVNSTIKPIPQSYQMHQHQPMTVYNSQTRNYY